MSQVPDRTRSRKAVPLTSAFFGTLNRDIRNVIYSYLAFPPFDRHESYSGLEFTCRQAYSEAQQEAKRALRLFLRHLNGLQAATHHFDSTRELTLRFSDYDLETVSEASKHLLELRLTSLTLHFACELSNPRALFAKLVWGIPTDRTLRLQTFTLSWDHRQQMCAVTLDGRRWSMTDKLKKEFMRKRGKSGSKKTPRKWPTLLFAQNEELSAGIIRLEVDMACVVSDIGRFDLMSHVKWDIPSDPAEDDALVPDSNEPNDEIDITFVKVECEVGE